MGKLTSAEQLSGEEYREAFRLFWTCPGDWTIAELREEIIRRLARSQNTKEMDDARANSVCLNKGAAKKVVVKQPRCNCRGECHDWNCDWVL